MVIYLKEEKTRSNVVLQVSELMFYFSHILETGQSREERRIDREYDVVIVLSDAGGGCLSGSESDDSDWSIGWLEPHGNNPLYVSPLVIHFSILDVLVGGFICLINIISW